LQVINRLLFSSWLRIWCGF